MRRFFRRALHQILSIARELRSLNPCQCLPDCEPMPRSSRSVKHFPDDMGLVENRSCGIQSIEILGEEQVTRGNGQEYELDFGMADQRQQPPGFTDGTGKVITAKDDKGKVCFALLITRRMVEAQNDLALAEQDRKAKRVALQRIKAKERKLQELISQRGSTQEILTGKETNEQNLNNGSSLHAKVEKVGARKKVIQAEIEALEDNIDFCKTEFQEVSQEAMEEANLLRKPEMRQTDTTQDDESEDSDETEQGEEYKALLSEANPLFSDEERIVREAQVNFYKAEQALFQAQAEFDRKEWRYQMELANFEAAAAVEETDWTRSHFDRQAILIGQDLTRDLINAECAFDDARNNAERIGAFDDGWGQDSYYGDSQRAEQSLGGNQVPQGGFPSVLSAATQDSIQTWAGKVTVPDADEVMEPVDVDEWDSAPIDVSDSVSCIDFGPLGRRVVEWAAYCDEHRQEWLPQEPKVEDIWTAVNSPLSRRKSCGV